MTARTVRSHFAACSDVIKAALRQHRGHRVDEVLIEELGNALALEIADVFDPPPNMARTTHGKNGVPEMPAMKDPYAVAREEIRAAIVKTRAKKIKVRPGTVGLQRGHYSELWMEDPGEQGVSPIGAFLLGKATDVDAPNVAASDGLNVSNAWCAGLDAGFADEFEQRYRQQPGRDHYQLGFEFGQVLRKEILNGRV